MGEPVVLHSARQTSEEVMWSPDGSLLAALSLTELEVWDSASWELVYARPRSLGWNGHGSLVWSDSGDQLAAAGDSFAFLIDAGSWETQEVEFDPRLGSKGRVAEINRQLAELGAADAQSLELILRAESTIGKGVSFCPDGERLAVLSFDDIKISESQSDQILVEIDAKQFEFYCLAWHPSGNVLAAGDTWTGRVWLFDTEDGSLITRYDHGEGAVWCVSWNPQGDLLASGSSDGTAVIWDVSSGERLKTIQLRPDPVDEFLMGIAHSDDEVESLAWSPDGTELACGQNGLRVWPVLRGV